MSAGTGSPAVRVDASNQLYIVNWQTDQCITGACTLDPNTVYRIIISLGKTALGHADVFVVANQQQ